MRSVTCRGEKAGVSGRARGLPGSPHDAQGHRLHVSLEELGAVAEEREAAVRVGDAPEEGCGVRELRQNCAGIAPELRGAPHELFDVFLQQPRPPGRLQHAVHPHLLLLARDEAAVRRVERAVRDALRRAFICSRLLGRLIRRLPAQRRFLRALEASLRHQPCDGAREIEDRFSERREIVGTQQPALAAARHKLLAQPPLQRLALGERAAAAARRPFSKVEER